jgi:hypothetical protein
LLTKKKTYSEEEVKRAFSEVKKDILFLKEEIEHLKSIIIQNKPQNEEKKVVSTGNEGVVNRHFSRTFPGLFQDFSTINQVKNDIKHLDNETERFIKLLTDKEYSIFIVVYQLEEELGRQITYKDISKRLITSQRTVNFHINNLILKGAPINKEIISGKVSISISKEFKDLKILDKILISRHLDDRQIKLSDILSRY